MASAILAATACTSAPQPISPSESTTSAFRTWSTPTDQALPAATAEALQAALETYLAFQDVPGATAAVVTTEGLWAGASGVDGVGTPLEPRSASAIASITKTFVAAEVLLLSARGEVDLDSPVDDYVDLPFDTGGATVREVLGMESGFPPDPVNVLDEVTVDLDREWTDDEVLDLVVAGSAPGLPRRGADLQQPQLPRPRRPRRGGDRRPARGGPAPRPARPGGARPGVGADRRAAGTAARHRGRRFPRRARRRRRPLPPFAGAGLGGRCRRRHGRRRPVSGPVGAPALRRLGDRSRTRAADDRA